MIRKSFHKYKAKRTTINGKSFPSQLEANLYATLLRLEEKKEIKDLQLQDSVLLVDAKKPINRIRCKIDFKATHCVSDMPVWFEAKGIETDRWRLVKKLWRAFGPGRLEVWKGSGKSLFLAEVIERET